MASVAKLSVRDGNPVAAVQELLKGLLERGEIRGVLVLTHLFGKGMPMPALITDPEALEKADPLAPAYPLNTARMAARLTRGGGGGKVAAVLRPCEIRAFVELVKLNQGSMEDIFLISMDCFGAFSNRDYPAFVGADDSIQSTLGFLGKTGGAKDVSGSGPDLASACRVCEYPVPETADLILGLAGADLHESVPVIAASPRGEGMLTRLGLEDGELPQSRESILREMISTRTEKRDAMFEDTAARVADLPGLADYLSSCVNCLNCRVACPVCYCRECVFNTDVFEHRPWQYLGWAEKRGSLKMPTDTLFFHMTRLAHMSTACVGCGQCSNACPNDVPVMELFRTVSAKTQASFDYVPGRSLEEAPPMSVFREDEYEDTVSHLA